MKKQNAAVVATVETCAASIITVAGHDTKAKAAAAELGRLMVALFIAHSGSDADFVATFGNGENGAKRVPGALADAVNTKLPKDKERAKSILAVLKVRLSEARKLRRDGGMANPDDANIQASLKRYAKAKAAAPKMPNEEAGPRVVFHDDATMDEVAHALSLWVSKHGAAASGLARKLADFMPVQLKRMPKVS